MIWRRLLGYFPASLAGGLASFGAVFALTRLLSPADYGFYALALTTMGIVYTLSITWAEAAAYRFAGEAEAKNKTPDHIRTIMALLAASSALGIALMLGAILIATDPVLRMALAAAMSIPNWIFNISRKILPAICSGAAWRCFDTLRASKRRLHPHRAF